jgi:hypothetical protein
MAQTDYGELTYHGLGGYAYDEAETGVAGEDFGEGDWHGLEALAYAVETAALRLFSELRRRAFGGPGMPGRH